MASVDGRRVDELDGGAERQNNEARSNKSARSHRRRARSEKVVLDSFPPSPRPWTAQLAQVEYGMFDTLPLELQSGILRLALPPIASTSLRERAQACIVFALVHRSWTTAALKELHEHLSIKYGRTTPSPEAAAAKLAAVRAGGWEVKRLHVEMGDYIVRDGAPNLFIPRPWQAERYRNSGCGIGTLKGICLDSCPTVSTPSLQNGR